MADPDEKQQQQQQQPDDVLGPWDVFPTSSTKSLLQQHPHVGKLPMDTINIIGACSALLIAQLFSLHNNNNNLSDVNQSIVTTPHLHFLRDSLDGLDWNSPKVWKKRQQQQQVRPPNKKKRKPPPATAALLEEETPTLASTTATTTAQRPNELQYDDSDYD